MGDQLAGTIAVLLSDGREEGGDFGDSEGGDSDGCDSDGWDEGSSEGCDDGGGGADGSLLGTDDGLLLGAEEGWLLGADEGGSSDDGLLLGGLLGEEGLLLGEDGLLLFDDGGDDEGKDEGDEECDEDDPLLLLLDFGQQPSPSARTSHLSLSAKCFAKPYVPAGITTGPPELPLDSSGNKRPIESTTVNVKSTGQYTPSYRTSLAKALPQRGNGSRSWNRQWSSYDARITGTCSAPRSYTTSTDACVFIWSASHDEPV